MSYWLRLYTGILDDPKVQRLQPEHFKGWVNLLCLAKEHDGLLPEIETIAFRLRIEDAQAEELIKTLKARGLIDDAGGDLTPHNWSSRQYETDAAAAAPSPSEKGAVGNHVRWHVGRGVLVDDCVYCRPESPPIRSDPPATSHPNRTRLAPESLSIAPESHPILSESPGESPPNRPDSDPNRWANRAEAETEAEADSEAEQQKQSRGDPLPAQPAAAAAGSFSEAHSSRFSFAEVEDFVLATKPHSTNPGGLARKLWRTGEEDAAIELWKRPREPAAPERQWPKWVFDGDVEANKRLHLQMVEAQRALEDQILEEDFYEETEGA